MAQWAMVGMSRLERAPTVVSTLKFPKVYCMLSIDEDCKQLRVHACAYVKALY